MTKVTDDPHPPRFLLNAKMRHPKTFTTYLLARRVRNAAVTDLIELPEKHYTREEQQRIVKA